MSPAKCCGGHRGAACSVDYHAEPWVGCDQVPALAPTLAEPLTPFWDAEAEPCALALFPPAWALPEPLPEALPEALLCALSAILLAVDLAPLAAPRAVSAAREAEATGLMGSVEAPVRAPDAAPEAEPFVAEPDAVPLPDAVALPARPFAAFPADPAIPLAVERALETAPVTAEVSGADAVLLALAAALPRTVDDTVRPAFGRAALPAPFTVLPIVPPTPPMLPPNVPPTMPPRPPPPPRSWALAVPGTSVRPSVAIAVVIASLFMVCSFLLYPPQSLPSGRLSGGTSAASNFIRDYVKKNLKARTTDIADDAPPCPSRGIDGFSIYRLKRFCSAGQ